MKNVTIMSNAFIKVWLGALIAWLIACSFQSETCVASNMSDSPNGLAHSFVARRQTLQTYFFSVCFVSAGVFFPLRCNLITFGCTTEHSTARRCHHRSRQKHFIFMLRACFPYKLDTKVQMKLTNKCNAILITRRRLSHYLPPLRFSRRKMFRQSPITPLAQQNDD